MEKLNLLPFAVVWGVLALALIFLIVYRKKVADQEDDSLHILEGEAALSQQTTMAHRLSQIDRWGKVLTVLAVLLGLAVGCCFLYQQWVSSTNLAG